MRWTLFPSVHFAHKQITLRKMFTWDSKMLSGYENCKTIVFYGIDTIFKQTNKHGLPENISRCRNPGNSDNEHFSTDTLQSRDGADHASYISCYSSHLCNPPFSMDMSSRGPVTKANKAQVTIALLKQQCNYARKNIIVVAEPWYSMLLFCNLHNVLYKIQRFKLSR